MLLCKVEKNDYQIIILDISKQNSLENDKTIIFA